jgi:LmbE family N-acetylglucosaminyl deacetylase
MIVHEDSMRIFTANRGLVRMTFVGDFGLGFKAGISMRLGGYFPFLLLLLCLLAPPSRFLQAGGKDKPRKCIMVFGCHADDVEIMAGGTLAKYIANGYEGVCVCVENGLTGSQIEKIPGNWDFGKNIVTGELTHSPRTYPVDALESSQMRQEEALRAARVFGAEPVLLNFVEPEFYLGRQLILYGRDEFNQYNPPGRKHVNIATHIGGDVDLVADLLKEYQPEITIIHTLGGEVFEANEGSYIVYMAFMKAISGGVPVGKLWMNIDGWLLDGVGQRSGRGKADVHVDVKDFLRTKYDALDKHVSQNGGFGREHALSRSQKRPKEAVEEFITVIDNTK